MTQPPIPQSPACKNNLLSYLQISIPVGLALFAMFFGAGNLVYPLAIGVEAGQHIWAAVLGFILMGVGIPWFGVYVSSLYQGSSTAFFSRLGTIPGKIIAGIILLLIGILVANPRTATVTANTIGPFFPDFKGQQALIQGIFFALVYLASAKSKQVVEILGYFFSPLKLILLFLLIVASLISMQAWQANTLSATHVLTSAITNGYNTMDLFASVFFCGIAYSAIKRRAEQQGIKDPNVHRRLSLLACVLGATVIAVVYLGFILAAAGHSAVLAHVPTAKLITVLSEQTLGMVAAAAVAAVVSFACLGTSTALTVAVTHYIRAGLFKDSIGYQPCLIGVILVNYAISLLGFDGIMKIAVPILLVFYPALIALVICNWLYKTTGLRWVKIPVYLTFLIALAHLLIPTTWY